MLAGWLFPRDRKLIGTGSFGQVWYYPDTGTAIKEIPFRSFVAGEDGMAINEV